MTSWRFAARDFINRQLENDEAFLVQTKMLSGKRIIVLIPDILPALVSLEIEIGTDGLVDEINVTDKEIEQGEGILRIIVAKKFIISRMQKVASSFLSPDENVSGRSSLFGQGLKIEGDVDDIQTVGDIVDGLVERIIRKYNDVKIFKEKLTKGTSWFLGDFIVRKRDLDKQSRALNELMERVRNLEKELKFPR